MHRFLYSIRKGSQPIGPWAYPNSRLSLTVTNKSVEHINKPTASKSAHHSASGQRIRS